MEEGQTVLFRFHDKERPSIVLTIDRQNGYATIVIGSTVLKPDKLPVQVECNSRAGRQMSLHHDTYFYDDKVMMVPLDSLFPLPKPTSCPHEVFRHLRHLLATQRFDPHLKTMHERKPRKSKILSVCLGDLIKHRS